MTKLNPLLPDTQQGIFDAVVNRLRDGTGRAMSTQRTGCTYLNKKTGNKCAVGIFIPDGHKAQEYGGLASKNMVRLYPDLDFDKNLKLLGKMQVIHDSIINWNEIIFSKNGERELEATAGIFNLKYSKESS